MGNRGGSVQKTGFIKLDLIKGERKQAQWREVLIKGGGFYKGEKSFSKLGRVSSSPSSSIILK